MLPKTIKVYRKGLIFQIPTNPLDSRRFGAHPAGDGVAWSGAEAIDVDQPHGLDYRALNHLAIAVRKRINKEHVAFGDSTAGGDHIPGGCQVTAFADGTDDVTQGYVDGTYLGHGLVWDTTGALWCITCDGTYTGQTPRKIHLHPDKMWNGGDVTWTGRHEFDASVDISGNVAIDGDLSVDGTVNFGSDVNFAADASFDGTVDFNAAVAFGGDVSIAGTLKVATDFSLTGDAAVDGTANFNANTDFGADATVQIKGQLDVTANTKILGDFTSKSPDNSALVKDVTYKATSDGWVFWRGASNVIYNCFIGSSQPAVDITFQKYSQTGVIEGIGFPIKKNWYYCVSGSAMGAMWFLPFGDGSADNP